MARDFRPDIEGYTEIQKEIAICRKYGLDYTADKGKKALILERLHPARVKLQVSEIIKKTAAAATIRLVSPDHYLPPFQAGQYINVFVEIDGIRTSRPYSISSPPNQTGYYDITVRRIAEGFVSDYLLDRIKAGDILESTAPSGNFYYNPLFHGQDLVFLAGGSGITPFMSMIRQVTDCGLDRRIHLIYGCQTPEDAIFHRELLERADRHPNFSYDLVISNPTAGYSGLTGLLDANLIGKIIGDIKGKTFYLCGPGAMYDFCLPELQKMGITGRRIRREMFNSPAAATHDPAWPKDISSETGFSVKLSDGRTISARAGEPLMIALERSGILVPASCRSGECSLCRIKLLSGRVFQPSGVLVRQSDLKYGYIHSCAAYPISDLEILL